jgi:hypothetical protein
MLGDGIIIADIAKLARHFAAAKPCDPHIDFLNNLYVQLDSKARARCRAEIRKLREGGSGVAG